MKERFLSRKVQAVYNLRMTHSDSSIRFDWLRKERTGIPEVVFAQGKSLSQLAEIVQQALDRTQPLLMTRVNAARAAALQKKFPERLNYHELARCLQLYGDSSSMQTSDDLPAKREFDFQGQGRPEDSSHRKSVSIEKTETRQVSSPDLATVETEHSKGGTVAIVAAGSSDLPLVAEIEQTLNFLEVKADCYNDVGVAGLWRLTELREVLIEYPVLIAVAGMEGALFSVLAGMVKAPVIAVPSPVGYGVSEQGQAALNGALASCAPGIAVVNIDNGFGAAALAVKMLAIGKRCTE